MVNEFRRPWYAQQSDDTKFNGVPLSTIRSIIDVYVSLTLNSGIHGKFLFYLLIAKTMVCYHKVARLLNLKFVRGLQDDQAEMTETSGQCR